jgi:sterol desaturase/sphingolipid hydroxylase (fatty acid hydroxylase superfamily)
MLDALFAHRQLALLASAWGVLLLVAAAEQVFPRRPPARPRPRRWGPHLALAAGNVALVRTALPFSSAAAAVWAVRHDVGLLNALALPRPSAVLATVLLLDFVSYALHRLDHAVPLLWRLHRVHHADTDLDWSTGLRHHPASALFTTCARSAAAVALGAAPLGVLLHAVVARPLDRIGHANLRLPPRLDAWLRLVVVTPDAHAVHHSARPDETDSNFGTAFLVWDRLFGTYRAAPADGLAGMTIGLERFREARDCDLDRILLLPLRGTEAARAAIPGAAGGR